MKLIDFTICGNTSCYVYIFFVASHVVPVSIPSGIVIVLSPFVFVILSVSFQILRIALSFLISPSCV
nr:MAG TPA: hypothetical protein [Caudoviricetes sp.]